VEFLRRLLNPKAPAARRRDARSFVPPERSRMTITRLEDGHRILPYILDISRGGMRFRAYTQPGRLYKGDEVEIEILCDDGAVPLKLQGQVVRFKLQDTGQMFICGIQFRAVTTEAAARLERTLRHLRHLAWLSKMGKYGRLD